MNRRAFFALFAGAAGTAGAVKALETAAPAQVGEVIFWLNPQGIAQLGKTYGSRRFVNELDIRFAARDWADREIAALETRYPEAR